MNRQQQCPYLYSECSSRPALHFWRQFLTSRAGPRILVPDTFVMNDTSEPHSYWLYTNSDGCLAYSRSATLKDYISKTTAYCSPNQLTTIYKRATHKAHNGSGCDTRLYNCRFLHKLTPVQLGDQLLCLQKYIKAHGAYAFVCRTLYRVQGASHTSIITNKNKYHQDTQPEGKRFVVNVKEAHVVDTMQGAHLQDTVKSLREIVEWMRRERGIHLIDIAGDFLKDEHGNWWLVNVRAFTMKEKVVKELPLRLQKQGKERYQKTKVCKYCQKVFLESELRHRVTRKMLLELDRCLIHLQTQFDWLQKRQSMSSVDLHSLYQDLALCQRCYRLYNEVMSLIQLENKLFSRLGFTCEEPLHNDTVRLKEEAKLKEINNLTDSIPEGKICGDSVIDLGPNSKIQVRDMCPVRLDQVISKMYRYRVILYLHQLYQMPVLKPNLSYSVQYTIFGVKNRFKLDVVSSTHSHSSTYGTYGGTHSHSSTNGGTYGGTHGTYGDTHGTYGGTHTNLAPTHAATLQMRKLRIIYLFARSNEEVHGYIANGAPFQLSIVGQHRKTAERWVAGRLHFELKDLLSVKSAKKKIYKCIDGQAIGWGIQLSVGIARSEEPVNTSRLILKTEDKLVYFPPPNYYCCEYLPEEWIEEIEKKGKATHGHQFNEEVEECSKGDWKTFASKEETVSTLHQSLFQQISNYETRKVRKNKNQFSSKRSI